MIIAVAGGGAAGALARWALVTAAQRSTSTAFPVGTLAANAIGCLLAGFCYVWLVDQSASLLLRRAILVGFLGALTTFSAYSVESIELIDHGKYLHAGANLIGSVIVGLVAVLIGMALARSLTG
ncbi:MAG: fluoride efflux transporter CrcB [Planctomycetaceae bacterium]|nr:fluoride efflux transporter CrcB [Planctomycetaceae bacterium]